MFVGDDYTANSILVQSTGSTVIYHSTTLIKPSNFVLSVHQGNPLHIAARRGDLDTVRQLIAKGTDFNVRDHDGVSQEFRECTTPAWFLHLP